MLTIDYVKNPFFNDVNNETIFVMVKFEEFNEELPFTATPYDDVEHGQKIYADLKAGKYGEIKTYEQSPHYTPPTDREAPNQPQTTGTQQA
jgi:hypothetical protein